jgi:hypothetical protein
MEDRLRALEERVTQLEALLSRQTGAQPELPEGTILQAPLKVVDGLGAVLLDLHEAPNSRVLRLFNTQGFPAVTLGVDGTEAGWITICNAAGQPVARLDVEMSGARLQLLNHAQQGGIVLFGGDSGDDAGGGLHVLHTDPAEIAISLWATSAGGQIQIYDAQTGDISLELPPHG